MNSKTVEIFLTQRKTLTGVTGNNIELDLRQYTPKYTQDGEQVYIENIDDVMLDHKVLDIQKCVEGDITKYFAIDPELEKYLSAKHKAEVERLQHRIDGLKKGNSELYKTVTDFVTKFYKLEENIDNASLWSRIKYVFTGKIK